MKAGNDVICALGQLLEENEVNEQQLVTLCSFLCVAYCPKGVEINSIPEHRWYLFCKHMAESGRLPPTLKEHACLGDVMNILQTEVGCFGGGTVMVWKRSSYYRRTDLVHITRTLNVVQYRDTIL